MHIQKIRYKKILFLSCIYCFLFIGIVFAFPEKTHSPTKDIQLYSAPDTIDTETLPIIFLPVYQEKKKNTEVRNTGTGSVYTGTFGAATSSEKKDCTSIGLCGKIHFGSGYTTAQKNAYYKSIIDIIAAIQSTLPAQTKLSQSLFSLTLYKTTGDRRGRGGSRTITIHTEGIKTQQEFRELLSHELGHIIDLGVITGSSTIKNMSFALGDKTFFSIDDASISYYTMSRDNTTTRKATASYKDFVGGYAMTSPYEDFAESFTAFLWHNDAFKAMTTSSPILAKKYFYLYTLLQGFSFEKDTVRGKKIREHPGRRPRDITRMSLE